MFDIAIIGAGPAGSTLARLVADRYRVLLIDKRQLDGKASKMLRWITGSRRPENYLSIDVQQSVSKSDTAQWNQECKGSP